MSRLMRWEPSREPLRFREMMDRFFNEPLMGTRFGADGAALPTVDMYQTEDEIVVKATLPGVKPDDIAISVAGDVLTLRGTPAEEAERKNATYHVRERRQGEFLRSLPLPAPVVPDKAKAEFEDGILTLTLPKEDEVKAKTITVKAK
ncbi:MAG TPA: Hsp20/alpha crystallin family protein [Anaerolineales bacterium]|nr:Hsp20/alpha crystallin family protein [Anaerolineales bacterium]